MTVSQVCNLSRCDVLFYTLNGRHYEPAATYFANVDRLVIVGNHNDLTFDSIVVCLEADTFGNLVAYVRL